MKGVASEFEHVWSRTSPSDKSSLNLMFEHEDSDKQGSS